jgi:multidrug efflux pump subunit AcrB
MKPLVAWFARNPVAANILLALIVVAGGMSARSIKMEMFPEFSLDSVLVRVLYPGAAPEEVEESICIPIEEEVHAIEGVKEVTSTASEGVGTVTVEVRAGEDPRRVLEDVKTRVDAIDTFPEEAERPVIEELLMRRQVINVAIFGAADERTLKELGERVRDDVNALPGITQVELASARPYEISIEVSEFELRRLGLTFDEVADAVRSSSLDLSGGSIKTEGGEILLRTVGQAYLGPDFEEVVVRTRPDGTRILLGDVATVVDGFEDTDQDARFDGAPVVMLQVFRVGDESALDISRIVREYIATTRETLPAGIGIEPWQDNAKMLQSRLTLLLRNGLQGLALVFLVLALFLKFRLSFWVTIGIPLSFLGALMVMPWFDQSVNMLSLFAFILVLGIVVDDAIVVGENIYKEHELGNADVGGAIAGVQGVSVPVVFAVLTTITAFLPMILLPGLTGKFFAVIPMTVIPALAFSLIESQLILPSHLAHEGGLMERIARVRPFSWWTALQTRISNGLTAFIERVYRPTLERVLHQRYLALATGLALLVLSFGVVGGGLVKFVFFPDIGGDVVAAELTMPQGTSAWVTERAVDQMEGAAEELRRELEADGDLVIRHYMASVGEQPFLAQRMGPRTGAPNVGSHYGEVVLELAPSEEREVTSEEVARRWRELCGPIAGASDVVFEAALMSAGDPLNIQLAGRDVEDLRVAAEELKARLATYPGVFDVAHTFRGGKDELVLDLEPAAESLGLTRLDLARQVRQGFHGEEAQRIQRGRDEIKVMVRYPERDRSVLAGLETMRVRTRGGSEVPFSAVASATQRQGYTSITRRDRMRTVNVSANVDLTVANPTEVLRAVEADVLPELMRAHPSMSYSLEGQSSDQVETMAAMSRWFLIALFAIYGLMAIPFRSYVQPLIIMIAIPFGFVGALGGHLLMGLDLSMLSVLGLVALAGVVVNDSLVLIDYVNRLKRDGAPLVEAVRQAGVARFRPILLTSLTTFAGLLPLLLERSVQAQFLVPMAVSLAFGVLFTTFVTLLLVPAVYLILEDLARLPRWLYGSERTPAPEKA